MKKTLILLLGMILLYSCSNTSDSCPITAVPPSLTTTTAATEITSVAASIGSTISNDGGASIIARGVVWSTSPSPTISLNTKTNDGIGKGSFISTVIGLNAASTYFVRAYATNCVGTTYGDEVSFTTVLPGQVGGQTWAIQNLDVETYSDGTPIPQVTDPAAWANLTTGAWCYYGNSSIVGAIHGKLYNWYAVEGIWNEASKTDVAQRKKLAPTGYHIPSDAEWTTLTTYLGGESVAGGKMKAIKGWTYENGINNTNSSGFSGLPGGYRNYNGSFNFILSYGNWWSKSENVTTPTLAWTRYLYYDLGLATRTNFVKKCGLSVRCLRD